MNLLTKDSETFGEQIRHRISQHAALYDEGFELELSEFHYYQFQMIELTVPQYGAIYSRLPLLVTGVAGSGKTCTAISLLEQILLSI
jgi:type II secretory ATPase GspE/PulE/Tfp pilus assembly ATPase PilB-like protein